MTDRYKVKGRVVTDSEDNGSIVSESPTPKLAENVCRCLNNCDSADKIISKHIKKKNNG